MLTPECAATETPPSAALKKPDETLMLAMPPNVPPPTARSTAPVESTPPAPVPPLPPSPPAPPTPPFPVASPAVDRKSVVQGKSVSDRVHDGGRRVIKKNNNNKPNTTQN